MPGASRGVGHSSLSKKSVEDTLTKQISNALASIPMFSNNNAKDTDKKAGNDTPSPRDLEVPLPNSKSGSGEHSPTNTNNSNQSSPPSSPVQSVSKSQSHSSSVIAAVNGYSTAAVSRSPSPSSSSPSPPSPTSTGLYPISASASAAAALAGHSPAAIVLIDEGEMRNAASRAAEEAEKWAREEEQMHIPGSFLMSEEALMNADMRTLERSLEALLLHAETLESNLVSSEANASRSNTDNNSSAMTIPLSQPSANNDDTEVFYMEDLAEEHDFASYVEVFEEGMLAEEHEGTIEEVVESDSAGESPVKLSFNLADSGADSPQVSPAEVVMLESWDKEDPTGMPPWHGSIDEAVAALLSNPDDISLVRRIRTFLHRGVRQRAAAAHAATMALQHRSSANSSSSMSQSQNQQSQQAQRSQRSSSSSGGSRRKRRQHHHHRSTSSTGSNSNAPTSASASSSTSKRSHRSKRRRKNTQSGDTQTTATTASNRKESKSTSENNRGKRDYPKTEEELLQYIIKQENRYRRQERRQKAEEKSKRRTQRRLQQARDILRKLQLMKSLYPNSNANSASASISKHHRRNKYSASGNMNMEVGTPLSETATDPSVLSAQNSGSQTLLSEDIQQQQQETTSAPETPLSPMQTLDSSMEIGTGSEPPSAEAQAVRLAFLSNSFLIKTSFF